jgi:hypothetical protein
VWSSGGAAILGGEGQLEGIGETQRDGGCQRRVFGQSEESVKVQIREKSII